MAKGSIWYLVGAVDGEVRSYRVSRVQQARITEEPCVRPEGFDLAAFWEQSVAEFQANVPSCPVQVRVAPECVARLRCSRRPIVVHEEPTGEDGWAAWSVLFEDEGEACDFLIRLGPRIHVIEPAALRTPVREWAESIVAVYYPERIS